jgi:two-component system response regulator NreC
MNIVIFDKIEIIRIGLKYIIANNSEHNIIADTDETKFLCNLIMSSKIDILVVGFFENYIKFMEFLTKIRQTNAKVKILVFSENIDEFFIFKALKVGVSGFIEKKSSSNEIIDAINTIAKDEDYFSETVANIILKSYIKNIKSGEEISEKKPRNLTRREIQILKLVGQGLTNQQIADGLFISIRTVNAHKNHIMQKLGLKTTADLIKFAIKNKYVDIW